MADPLFVGFCALRGAECGVKTVSKVSAHEKVGVLATVGGQPAVVEYSEISKEMAEATAEGGGEGGRRHPRDGARLLYGDAHICVNWFALAFLARFAAEASSGADAGSAPLPLHVARKAVRTPPPWQCP